MMMHKSPALKVVCLASWLVVALVSVSVGATPLGWNLLANSLMNMPALYYVVLVAGLINLASFVMMVAGGSHGCSCGHSH